MNDPLRPGREVRGLWGQRVDRAANLGSAGQTDSVQQDAQKVYQEHAKAVEPPPKLSQRFQKAVRQEQLHDLEQLWFAAGDERSKFARDLLLRNTDLYDRKNSFDHEPLLND